MTAMKNVAETRRDRLLSLVLKYGRMADLNQALGWARNDPRLSQIKNASMRSGQAGRYQMGSAMARQIEKTLSLPDGWMDTPVADASNGPKLYATEETSASREVRVMSYTAATPTLAAALAVLANVLIAMDDSTRRKSAALVADLALDPTAHAQVASAIEAMANTQTRVAA